MSDLFFGFESWVVSRLCYQECFLEQLLLRPMGGTPGRRYMHCPSLYCLSAWTTLARWDDNGHVLFLSLESWLLFPLEPQVTQTHKCGPEAPWRQHRDSRAGGPMASERLGVDRETQGHAQGTAGLGYNGEEALLIPFIPISTFHCSALQNSEQMAHISH